MDLQENIRQLIAEAVAPLFDQQREELKLLLERQKEELMAYIWQKGQNVAPSQEALPEQMGTPLPSPVDRKHGVSPAQQKFAFGMSQTGTRNCAEKPSPQFAQPEQAHEQVMYAKQMDADAPKGFLTENLKADASGAAFRLFLSPDRTHAEYEFVEDPAIQREILEMFVPVVSESSTYDRTLDNATTIIIEERGRLSREGHVMRIERKQKVRFEA